MTRSCLGLFGTVAAMAMFCAAAPARAQNQMEQNHHMDHGDQHGMHSLPSRKIVGATVKNANGEKLGSVEDVVIDADSGKVAYVALGVGGVLGMGEKLFAVPFEHFKIGMENDKTPYLVLDVAKERFEKAPGFDKNNWPDFGNTEYRNEVNNYYHNQR